jgi:hypothetical protein
MRRRVPEAPGGAKAETCARDPRDETTFQIRDIEGALHTARSGLDDLVQLALDGARAKRRRVYAFHRSGIREHMTEVLAAIRCAEMELRSLHLRLLGRK